MRIKWNNIIILGLIVAGMIWFKHHKFEIGDFFSHIHMLGRDLYYDDKQLFVVVVAITFAFLICAVVKIATGKGGNRS